MVMVTDRRAHFFPLKPPWSVVGVLSLLHLAALASIWSSGLPFWGQWAASLLAIAGLMPWVYRLGLGHLPGQWQGLEYDIDGCWWLESRAGQRLPVRVLPDSVVLPGLILLLLRDEAGRHHRLPLTRDALVTGDLRPLRLCLRQSVRDRTPTDPDP
ncbi:hypothetical protein SAMN05421693_10331 [Ectothiorhodospira magna]|uniref:Toxin CptA n=2 Tax=Ectothiorhodospira magna TaxID=867345 RepID=A0A1H8ZRP8_9GAMM|nr:hypothetical protein SAMN05421693_10331 [Ectothiorhodospira magna]